MNHSVNEKADAGLCGAILYSAALDGSSIPKQIDLEGEGLAFKDFGDNDSKKRQFKAKTAKNSKNGDKINYTMTVELEDWPIATYASASSIEYSNKLIWKPLSAKKNTKNRNRAQSLSTIS